MRDPLRDHIANLQRLMQLLLAERGHTLTGEEIAILDLALAATYANEWRDEGTGEARGGYTTDPRTHRRERTPLMADLLQVLRHAQKYLPPVNRDLLRSWPRAWRAMSRGRSPTSSASRPTWRSTPD